MYVDKLLTGVAAVQTLSRINRIHPLKTQEDVFVLDFANEAVDIQEQFKRSTRRPVRLQPTRTCSSPSGLTCRAATCGSADIARRRDARLDCPL